MRLVYDTRSRQPRIEYVTGRGGRGRGAGAAGAAGAGGGSAAEGAAVEPPPQMDEEGLLTLLRLLRLSQVCWC